jgi:hypothetical protein
MSKVYALVYELLAYTVNYGCLIMILLAVKVATDSVKSINDSYISYLVKFQLSGTIAAS